MSDQHSALRVKLSDLIEGMDFQSDERSSCYVNLQEKRKTLPLSGPSHRLVPFSLSTDPSMRTSHQ